MLSIAVVVGSTRPNRRSREVAEWVLANTSCIEGARFGVIDLAEHSLPMYDEPEPAAVGAIKGERAQQWANTIDPYDAFIFIVPEYNHSFPAVLKNGIDLAFKEWNDKAAGFVSYGLQGGVRAVEHLRGVIAEVKLAGVRTQVALSLFTDFTLKTMNDVGKVTPGSHQVDTLQRMIVELKEWGGALRELRVTRLAEIETE